MQTPLHTAVPWLVLLALSACRSDGRPGPEGTARTATPEPREEAAAFVEQVNEDLKRLWSTSARAAWVKETYITDDTEAMSAAAEEEVMAYTARAIERAAGFDEGSVDPKSARQLRLLKLSASLPAPKDKEKRAELARLSSRMVGLYGKGQWCPEGARPGDEACQTLNELEKVLAESRDPAALRDAWVRWRTISPPMRPLYERFVELGNEGAREIGFDDLGQLWRSRYDMPPDDFAALTTRLWEQVRPLYEELHCYVRERLAKRYPGEAREERTIPAHLLGNMWSQSWNHIYPLVEPYQAAEKRPLGVSQPPDERSLGRRGVRLMVRSRRQLDVRWTRSGARIMGLRTVRRARQPFSAVCYPGHTSVDVTKALRERDLSARDMVELGEAFFTSLGFDALPDTFWQRSMFVKPRDRDVVCHASAWDITYAGDVRIKMCIEQTEEDLTTIHHELGHIYYFLAYKDQPALYQDGANDGFHEAIGDAIALSVTPHYLAERGILSSVKDDERAVLNFQMRSALEKIAFLPFGKLIDEWRWEVFEGKTKPDAYNRRWWELRRQYQGIHPPVARSEADFDPGAKFHIPANVPYMRYFLAHILQFQFHQALCDAAGHEGPLHACSISGNEAAGARLAKVLEMGASQPWPDALYALTGAREMDAAPLVEYFEPLRAWLEEQNRGARCGW